MAIPVAKTMSQGIRLCFRIVAIAKLGKKPVGSAESGSSGSRV
jgi:hypothetical protein